MIIVLNLSNKSFCCNFSLFLSVSLVLTPKRQLFSYHKPFYKSSYTSSTLVVPLNPKYLTNQTISFPVPGERKVRSRPNVEHIAKAENIHDVGVACHCRFIFSNDSIKGRFHYVLMSPNSTLN